VNISVLLSSGDVDDWEEVQAAIDMNLGGALVITEADNSIAAIYAGGMWMRFMVKPNNETGE
jgi:hypothetical protein